MCGIFGEFLFKNKINLKNCLKRLDTLKHRGPDGYGFEYGNFCQGTYYLYHNDRVTNEKEGFATGANYFLGHRRLSIIDLNENAFQPLESIDKRFSIIFNGEIYNFIELREELVQNGCQFKTDHSDTEALLNAYSLWGKNCLKKLRGMFAFAILDRKDGIIFLARDRIGQKPLYYEISEYRFSFSSELGPLFKYTDRKKPINQEALVCYMAYGYIPHPISIFEGINKLPPATYAMVDLNSKKIELKKYWDIEVVEDKIKSAEDFLKEVESILTESVSLRMRSDVPIGAFLSGGTDSTLIVKKIKEIGKREFDVFGADFPQRNQSERIYIEHVANRYKQKLNLSRIDLSQVKNIKRIVNVFDEPFDGGSSIALFDLFMEANKNYKVILTGDGGDEMFAGYTRYPEFIPRQRNLRLFEKLYFPKKLALAISQLPIQNRKVNKLKKLIEGDFIHNYLLLNNSVELVKLLKKSIEFRPDQFVLYNDIRSKINEYRFSPIKALQYLEINTILPGRMLYKLDRFSMYYNVEARSPFLDHKLVEKAFTIPERFNVQNGETKKILKKLLEQDFDRQFVYREKHGFGNPLSHWFREGAREEIFRVLLDRSRTIYRYIDYDKLHLTFPQIKEGYDGTREKDLWRLLVLGEYLENIQNWII